MFFAKIGGWTEVYAFADTAEKAKKLAVAKKKSFARDDLEKWTWETVADYYGATCIEIKPDMVFSDNEI